MGNSISSRRFTPERITHCINENMEFDMDLYLMYRRNRRLQLLRSSSASSLPLPGGLPPTLSSSPLFADDAAVWDEFMARHESRRQQRRNQKKKTTVYRRDEAGNLVAVTPTDSLWWTTYVHPEQGENADTEVSFRRKFRLPKEAFRSIVEEMRPCDEFRRWGKKDATGALASPLELLLLGSLRYLARAWTFDDLEDVTCISEETHRQFFHVFIKWGSSTFFKKMVYFPTTAEEAKTHMAELTMAGLPGCVRSCDATHIPMDRCFFQQANAHRGKKLNKPCRAYNVTVNHRRRILASTTGHPGRWNDKTLQIYDKPMVDLSKGKILSDVAFYLYEKNSEDGMIYKRKCMGGWIIVDNGYIHWPTMVPPFKEPFFLKQQRFSEWIESLRKDVECTFGIMKRRFMILETGVRLHGVMATDRIWLTCCALHNFLLEWDGLDAEWQNGEEQVAQQAAIRSDVDALISDMMQEEHHATNETTLLEDAPIREEPALVVCHMTLEEFLEKLVEHHHILFENKKLVWPTCC